MENYEKKYKEALSIAKDLHDNHALGMPFIYQTCEDIFPELKESEDEKIRKALIRNFTNQHSSNFPTADGFTREQILAWLEKQGEQKEIDYDEELKKCKDNPLYFFDKYVKIKFKEQCEQEPAWSEEDERMYQSIIDDTVQENQLDDKQINWLESLKDRVQLQPKQEWGEEDKVWIDRACMLLDELNHLDTLTLAKIPHNLDEIISHIKSLKDRVQPNHWKPSEEQMDALDKAKNCPANYYDVRLGLESLYNDLRNL